MTEERQESTISIEQFVQTDLRVGKIIEVSIVEGSDRLYKLKVEFGELGIRQILSGVREFLRIEDLMDKLAIFVVNLEPKKFKGLESQGMLLAAQDDRGNFRIVTVSGEVRTGTRIR